MGLFYIERKDELYLEKLYGHLYQSGYCDEKSTDNEIYEGLLSTFENLKLEKTNTDRMKVSLIEKNGKHYFDDFRTHVTKKKNEEMNNLKCDN